MFSRIMVPVDLVHADKLQRAIDVSSQLARNYGAEVVYVGVTAATPSPVAHTPDEYRQKLDAFAKEHADKGGHAARGHAIIAHDPAVEIDKQLEHAGEELGADLIVMATHVPGLGDSWSPNHGGAIARHSKISVFLVRG